MRAGLALLLVLAGRAGLGAQAPSELQIEVPARLVPGSANVVTVRGAGAEAGFTVEVRRSPSQSWVARSTSFGPVNGAVVALVAPDALDRAGPVQVTVRGRGGALWAQRSAELQARSFPVEVIPLNATMTRLRAEPDPRKDRESAVLAALYQQAQSDQPWAGTAFRLPVLPTWPTSGAFGDTRVYRYADGSTARDYHRGTDFAVPVGTPVCAPAAARVVFSGPRLLTGNTVVLAHGGTLVSVYFHLALRLVAVGDQVEAGDLLGLSGATGLVTGPHLHWELRVDGVPVDSADFVRGLNLDKGPANAVLSSIERPEDQREGGDYHSQHSSGRQ